MGTLQIATAGSAITLRRRDLPGPRAFRRTALLGAGVTALALLVASGSCSSPDASAEETRAVPRPEKGGVLRLAMEDPISLDPADADSVYASFPVNQLFDGLVASDPGMRIVPALATEWTISRDGLVYTFQLRPGVTFHDGAPLTAEDVLFTIEHLLAPDHRQNNIASSYITVVSGVREYMDGKRKDLPGIEALDPLTVRIRLERPYASFLQVLALDGLRIIPKRLIEKIGDKEFDRWPVGTGPFQLASWSSDHLRLAANPAHFNGKPHLDAVEIHFLEPDEKDAGAERFRRGEIDVLEVSSEEMLDSLAKAPGINLHRYQELNLAFLGLGLSHPPLGDVRIRQAIARAIDRDAIVGDSPRTRRLATGILPPGIQGYAPTRKTLGHDPEEARRLLAEAGHPGGRNLPPIEFLTTSRSAASTRLAERIRMDLAAVGIEARLHEVPWSVLSDRIDSRTASLFKISWIADVNDPDSFLRSLFEMGGPTNYFGFTDRDTEELLRAGAHETNTISRDQIYRRAEERILALAPIIPLYHSISFYATREHVRELEPGPLGIAMLNLENVWFAGGAHRP